MDLILEETITELIHNSNMGGVQCMYECDRPNVRGVLYMDKNGWIKVGDVVKIQRTDKGEYIRMWINGVLNIDFTYNQLVRKIEDARWSAEKGCRDSDNVYLEIAIENIKELKK